MAQRAPVDGGLAPRHDDAEGIAPLDVGKDVAAPADTLVVIFAVVVGSP
jgi:hypothetical protein